MSCEFVIQSTEKKNRKLGAHGKQGIGKGKCVCVCVRGGGITKKGRGSFHGVHLAQKSD